MAFFCPQQPFLALLAVLGIEPGNSEARGLPLSLLPEARAELWMRVAAQAKPQRSWILAPASMGERGS